MRLLIRIFLLFLCVVVLHMVTQTASAQGPDATPTPSTPTPTEVSEQTLVFSDLGFNERTIFTPFASTFYEFALPSNWNLQAPVTLRLDLSSFVTGLEDESEVGSYGGLLEIIFNNETLDLVPVDLIGEAIVDIELPPEALITTRRDGRHQFQVSLVTDFQCENREQAAMLIDDTSSIEFTFENKSPLTDLRELPRPIFQRSFLTDQALIVIPDDPTTAELQAALTVSAGFGKNTQGRLDLSLVTYRELTEEQRATNDLILVGKTISMPIFADVGMPVEPEGIELDDGIVHIIPSPFSEAEVILGVMGLTDKGVIRAAQAVSSTNVRAGDQVNIAVIRDVNTSLAGISNVLSVNQSFSAGGYENRLLERVGRDELEYIFQIPPEDSLNRETVLNLFYSHSTLMDYSRSGVSIYVNDEPVGTLRLSDDSANGTQITISIPRTIVQTGINRLTFVSELFPEDACLDPQFAALWVKIDSRSSITTEETADTGEVATVIDLANFPNPFVLDPTLTSTSFVLPRQETDIWKTASELAFYLGSEVDASVLGIGAVYADEVTEEMMETTNLILMGRASSLPIIAELSTALPVPFAPASDFADENALQIVYRLPESKELGYLELFPSPANPDIVLLAVLGTTPRAVAWSTFALVTPRLDRFLAGTFQTVDEEQIVAYRTTDVQSITIPEAEQIGEGSNPILDNFPDPPLELIQETSTQDDESPEWVIPVVGVSITVIVLILVFVSISSILSYYRR